MTRTFLIPLACALCVQLFPLPGLTAEKPTYVSISHGQLSYELKGQSADADGILLGIGHRLTNSVSIEATFGQYDFDTIQLGDMAVSNAEAETFELTTLVTWPLTKTYQPFFLLGLIHAELEVPDLYEEDLQAPYIGLGLGIAGHESWQMRASYKSFPDHASAELLTVSLAYQF
ncbi:MAG: outer membrane beta-barrel protein [Parvibaculales bacterium]